MEYLLHQDSGLCLDLHVGEKVILKIKLILMNVMHNIQFFQQQLNQSSEPISHTNIHW